LEPSLRERLFSKKLADYGLKPEEAVTIVVLRSITKTRANRDISLTVTSDYRLNDASLQRTVGALTCLYEVPAELLRTAAGEVTAAGIREMLRTVFSSPKEQGLNSPARPKNQYRAVLRFEYFIEEPWLGGDQFVPRGFIVGEEQPLGEYSLEITPILHADGVEFRLSYQNGLEMRGLAESLADCLVREVVELLAQCDRSVAAQSFWRKEFASGMHEPHFDIGAARARLAKARLVPTPCAIDTRQLDRICLDCKVSKFHVLLASFAVLLSRVNGREEVVVVSALEDDAALSAFPLRLYPLWNLSLREFVAQVEQKTSAAFEHRASAFEVLSNELAGKKRDQSFGFDVGFAYGSAFGNGKGTAAIERSMKSRHVSNSGLTLALEATGREQCLNVQLVHDDSKLGVTEVKELASCLSTVLGAFDRSADIKLEDISFGKVATCDPAANALAAATFNF
jgi:hypothetical protein